MKKFLKAFLTLPVFVYMLFIPAYMAGAEAAVFPDTEESGDWAIMSDDDIIYSNVMRGIEYAYNDSTFSFYDQLDKNNKAAYDSMKQWLDFYTGSITITFPEVVSVDGESRNLNDWTEEKYNEFWNTVFDSLRFGECAIRFDYPEIFWMDLSSVRVQIVNRTTSKNPLTGGYTIKVGSVKLSADLKEEYEDIEAAKAYSKLLEDSLADFEVKGSDRYQKVKYIHDYIANTIVYDLTAPYCDSAVGLFCEPYALLCEGYSNAFKIICDRENIPCVVVPGNINTEKKTGHMWNYIMMEDGEWYGIDCTWDDTDSPTDPVKYNYFLKGSDSFGKNHIDDGIMIYPELCADDYVYDPSSVTEHIKGDYNMDGKLSVADITLLKRYLVGRVSNSKIISNDDMNDDGIINVFDCILLMKKILN